MGLAISGESSALGIRPMVSSPDLARLVTLSKSLPLSEAQLLVCPLSITRWLERGEGLELERGAWNSPSAHLSPGERLREHGAGQNVNMGSTPTGDCPPAPSKGMELSSLDVGQPVTWIRPPWQDPPPRENSSGLGKEWGPEE